MEFRWSFSSFREGLKKSDFYHFGSCPPPPYKVKKKFYFLDTRPLFENFLKKMFFPFEKSKTLRKIFKKWKNWLLHIHVILAAHPPWHPHIINNHYHKLLMELQGGPIGTLGGGGYPPIHEKFLWSRIA